MNIIASLSTIIAVLSVITSCYTVYRVKKQISEITDALVDVKTETAIGAFYPQQMN